MTIDKELLPEGLRIEQEAACTVTHIVTSYRFYNLFVYFIHLLNDKVFVNNKIDL